MEIGQVRITNQGLIFAMVRAMVAPVGSVHIIREPDGSLELVRVDVSLDTIWCVYVRPRPELVDILSFQKNDFVHAIAEGWKAADDLVREYELKYVAGENE